MEARNSVGGSSEPNNDAGRVSVIQEAAKFGIELDDVVAYELTEQERENYLKNETINTNRRDILSYDEVGRREVFAKKEGEFTTPVIITILLELQNTLNAHLAELAKTNQEKVTELADTKAIINITLAMFARSDKVFQTKTQRQYLSQLKERAKTKKTRMFQHLETLAALSEKIVVIPEMVKLLREFAIWEFGMYWNDAAKLLMKKQLNQVTLEPEMIKLQKPEEDGKTSVFPFVDNAKDWLVCYKIYGFRMLDVTYRHFEVSKIVNAKCDECKPQQDLTAGKKIDAGLSPAEIKKYKDFVYDVTPTSVSSVWRVNLTANVKYFTNSGAGAKSHLQAMLRNPLGVALSTKAHANDNQRFDDFYEKLKLFKMSDAMKMVVGGAQQSAVAVLESYVNSKSEAGQTILWVAGYFSPVPLDNKNVWLCKDVLQKLNGKKFSYEEIIKTMIDLRARCIQNCSTRLAVALTNFLNAQINIIIGSEALSGDDICQAQVTMCQSDEKDLYHFSFEVLEERVDIARKILDVFHSQIANPVGMKLAACKLQDEDETIRYFGKLLEEHRLSPIQEVEYADFYAQASGVLTAYIDPANLGYFNPHHYFERGTLPLPSLFERTHAAEVDKVLMKLRNTNLPVTDRLLELIKLYEHAIKENSQKLRTGLRLFLVKYIQWMTPAMLTENTPAQEPRVETSRSSSFKF